jgi:hypothetical protein
MGTLRSLFTEGPIARLLREEDDSLSHETGASGASLDSQVDRYLGEYEAAAKKEEGEGASDMPSADQMEALDWRDLVKGRLITEAGDENSKDEAEDDPDEAAPGADAMTGDDDDRPGLETFNVESFGNDVARLIDNYDNLLEVRSTLLRRAKQFLEKNYSDEVSKAFEDTMRDDHGMEAGNNTEDVNAEKFTAPAADRANGSAEPGGGGAAPV